jgi:DNA modification methylase
LRNYGHARQLGLEKTWECYVAALVAVFREVRRVLRDDGTVWLNLGDSYANPDKGGYQPSRIKAEDSLQRSNLASDFPEAPNRMPQTGLKSKDLMGIPWRVAFALQADGWYLRSDIIWAKPNPMPESVTDRPTKAHEYLFLLAKSQTYYYDIDAIREPHTHPDAAFNSGDWATSIRDAGRATDRPYASAHSRPKDYVGNINGRNKRTVWNIATMPYSGAHFATMPEALVEPCILAGCPLGGLVLDPFLGSGTVGAVAERLGRRWVGTDLSYQPLAQKRTAQRGIRFEPEEVA